MLTKWFPFSDAADKYPAAEVIGTDISPTQPGWVPPNLSFQIDDAQLEWTFKADSFDFIHVRYMQGAIDNWPRLYEQIYKTLKPGGYFQHIEPDIELRCDNPDVKVDDDQYVPISNLLLAEGTSPILSMVFSQR